MGAASVPCRSRLGAVKILLCGQNVYHNSYYTITDDFVFTLIPDLRTFHELLHNLVAVVRITDDPNEEHYDK